jgi:protein gp37
VRPISESLKILIATAEDLIRRPQLPSAMPSAFCELAAEIPMAWRLLRPVAVRSPKMSVRRRIEWTDATWNPIRARNLKTGKVGWHCEHATTGCEFCYAEGFNKRLGTGLAFKPGHRKDIEIFLDEEMLTQPLRWKKPRMIFVCSMTDLFADFVTRRMLEVMFAVMALTPQHTYQVLTKRAARMQQYVGSLQSRWDTEAPARSAADRAAHMIANAISEWPLPNVWLGVSAERQEEAAERIPALLNTPAAIRFISAEPLLGPINLHSFFDFRKWINALDGIAASARKPPAGCSMASSTTDSQRCRHDAARDRPCAAAAALHRPGLRSRRAAGTAMGQDLAAAHRPALPARDRPRGANNILAIAPAFKWAKFAPVVVAPIAGNLFAIVDGQHRTTAAALRGFESVPCVIIAPDEADQADAFVAINANVTAMSPLQLHAARLAAGSKEAAALTEVCSEAGVTICRYPVPANKIKPGETLAVAMLQARSQIRPRRPGRSAVLHHPDPPRQSRPDPGPDRRGALHVLEAEPDWRADRNGAHLPDADLRLRRTVQRTRAPSRSRAARRWRRI